MGKIIFGPQWIMWFCNYMVWPILKFLTFLGAWLPQSIKNVVELEVLHILVMVMELQENLV